VSKLREGVGKLLRSLEATAEPRLRWEYKEGRATIGPKNVAQHFGRAVSLAGRKSVKFADPMPPPPDLVAQ
jgi:hypothetical protein